jgi:hypothetical protein
LHRDNLRDKINEIKNKINSINTNEEMNKYYLDVGILLHNYYENIEISYKNYLVTFSCFTPLPTTFILNDEIILEEDNILVLTGSSNKNRTIFANKIIPYGQENPIPFTYPVNLNKNDVKFISENYIKIMNKTYLSPYYIQNIILNYYLSKQTNKGKVYNTERQILFDDFNHLIIKRLTLDTLKELLKDNFIIQDNYLE